MNERIIERWMVRQNEINLMNEWTICWMDEWMDGWMED